ncbi:3-oxoadipate enol-lactonase [Nocardioides insulae]|uniref:3-oxoadipate enol-lactonase n=1 Tax=Nocardioides insulae TaxID=394734 RepID=UPI00042155F4|nr:3-oxoadipate enol-lactonase [Nocardioides insulae]
MSAVDVHAVVTGRADAPAVILSNSLGSTHAMWDAQVTALEEHFRVVRYDTRGHGVSPVPAGPYTIDDLADDLVGVLDRYGIARAHVVGLSLGGATAMRVAARNPERVDRLALFCTAAKFDPEQAWVDRATLVRAEGTGAVAPAVVQRWFSPGWYADHPEEHAYYQAMIADTPVEGYAGCCDAIGVLDLRPDLAGIAAPTLVVAGADDQATPPAWLQVIADGIPEARLLVVPDSAHLAPAEQPDTITPALIEHLLNQQEQS